MATMVFAAFMGIAAGVFVAVFTCDDCYDDALVEWDGQF